MKKWEVLNKRKAQNAKRKTTRLAGALAKRATQNSKLTEEVIPVLLTNRGIKTKKEIEEFLNPQLKSVTVESVGIDKKNLKKAVDRIKKAVAKKEQVVVFGDYDVDGICASAILWETLYKLGAKALPYIPHRIDEGYGLSIKGIQNVVSVIPNSFRNLGSSEILKPASRQGGQVQDDNKVKLIITVDNGIVANEPVEFANKQGIDVIITDHHVPSKKLPEAYAVVHTTKLCGAGVAWMLAQQLTIHNSQFTINTKRDDHLGLVALATVADLVPLVGANRTLTKYGIEALQKTERFGIVALCKQAVIDQAALGTYEIGHVIAPRLNAMGRLEHAMDSLRLLCTKDAERAKKLALLLSSTNRERQELTAETVMHAKSTVNNQRSTINKLLFIAHESYQQGVIGLVAGKLVEEFYRPAIVIAKGETYSKASARSVHGFNIIEFIRSASEFLVDAGGHPMAAGFTVETAKLPLLQKALETLAHTSLDRNLLTRTLRVDCELPLQFVDEKLYNDIQKLQPFGMGNPQPTFVSRNVVVEDMRLVGKEGRHVKFQFSIFNFQFSIDGIGFGLGEKASELHVGDRVDVVYTIDENLWNGNKRLQLKVRDIKILNV